MVLHTRFGHKIIILGNNARPPKVVLGEETCRVPPRGQLSLTEKNEYSRGEENSHSTLLICYVV